MKITKRQLKRIIREEKAKLVQEMRPMRPGVGEDELVDGVHDGALMDLDDYESLENTVEKAIGSFVQMGYYKEDVIEALRSIIEDMK